MVNEPRNMIKIRSIFSLQYQGSNHDIRPYSDGQCEVGLIGNFPLPSPQNVAPKQIELKGGGQRFVSKTNDCDTFSKKYK